MIITTEQRAHVTIIYLGEVQRLSGTCSSNRLRSDEVWVKFRVFQIWLDCLDDVRMDVFFVVVDKLIKKLIYFSHHHLLE